MIGVVFELLTIFPLAAVHFALKLLALILADRLVEVLLGRFFLVRIGAIEVFGVSLHLLEFFFRRLFSALLFSALLEFLLVGRGTVLHLFLELLAILPAYGLVELLLGGFLLVGFGAVEILGVLR